MEYISTFNVSFFALIIYWLVTLVGEKLFEFITILIGKENLYLDHTWVIARWSVKGWLLLIAFAFCHSVPGTTTFFICIPLGLAVSFLIHLFFEYAYDWAAAREPIKSWSDLFN